MAVLACVDAQHSGLHGRGHRTARSPDQSGPHGRKEDSTSTVGVHLGLVLRG
ncbi:hypothetical protein SS05631_c40980 [Sinorhizobium sp. CCBAU 05631]|nr:hypothetical protein SS05631_c40980 [Sinorhizobium sp. CCBAU 05631]